jgi:hypothetical protein
LDPDKPTLQQLAGKKPEEAKPVKFPFVSAFLCERVLLDQDKLLSAIRIVDIFQIPEGTPEGTAIQFWAIVTLKTVPVPDEEVYVAITLVRVSGERERLPDQFGGKPLRLRDQTPDPSLPGGISLIVQLNVIPKNFGLCFLEVDVDGETLVRIPFTIRRIPATPVG